MSSSTQQGGMVIASGSNTNAAGNEGDPNIVASKGIPEGKSACKKAVRYTECLKNHAASLGGNSTDGCGEFMPSGDEGTLEALKCSACGCHRNFHRKEIECDCSSQCSCFQLLKSNCALTSPQGYATSTLICSKELSHQVVAPHKIGSDSNPSGSREKNNDTDEVRTADQQGKKRFRTKFTQEQKEKMINFAERAGWKIQKLEESVVQQFCQETGIKRRVLKVWMHNNKHSFAKRVPSS